MLTLASIPVVGVGGCSSGSSENAPAAMTEAPPEPVACDEITPFTPLDRVEECGSAVDVESRLAQSLNYQVPSSRVGEMCAGCSFYGGPAESVTGTCSFFPGELVSADAWCALYRPA
ncbi:MAG: high-potential iron-sulfur protein [Granulosicoccus sp.]